MSILQESAATAAADGKAQAPPQIDLATCAPDELSAWLLAHRFEDNAMDVASFLLNCTSTLPNAEEISAQLMGGGDDEEDDDDAEMEDGEDETEASGEGGGEAEPAAAVDPQTALLHSIQSSQPHPTFAHQNGNEVEVSCTNPRGKFVLSLREGGVVLTNPKKRDEEQIPVGPDNVSHVVWFRKPEEYKKLKQLNKNGTAGKKPLPGHMVLICLKEEGEGAGIKFRNKPLGQVCFQLPSYQPPTEENDDNKQFTEAAWWEGLSAALFSGEEGGIVRAHAAMDAAESTKGNGGFVYRSEGESGSATTTEGMPYVGCYQGFHDGALFPLREGLLFFKPPLFVPRSTLASISCGRGAGGSRYVDMVVQLDVPESDEQDGAKKKKQSDTLEFTNIHRDELNGLNNYLHKTLIPAMQADADGDSSSSDEDEEDEEDEEAVAEMVNSDEDESGSADEEKSNEEEEAGRKRRSSRAASKSAREITRAALNAGAEGDDESDDDSDVFEEDDATDSDGSDDDESDASSDDGEFDEEADDSEDVSDCEGRMSKKARVD